MFVVRSYFIVESVACDIISHPLIIFYIFASEDEGEYDTGEVAKPIPKPSKKKVEKQEYRSSDEEEQDQQIGIENVCAFFKKDMRIIKTDNNVRVE